MFVICVAMSSHCASGDDGPAPDAESYNQLASARHSGGGYRATVTVAGVRGSATLSVIVNEALIHWRLG
jgi:hypothetical protein